MRKNLMVALIAVMFVSLIGCSQSQMRDQNVVGSTLNVCADDIEPIFRVAKNVAEKDYQLASVNTQSGLIETVPIVYQGSEQETTLANVVVPAKKTFRRVVTIQVRKISEQIISISVRANVERLDTHYMEAYARMRQSDDTPSQTYQNSAAAVDREKREVWTPGGRDVKVEREILNAIKALVL